LNYAFSEAIMPIIKSAKKALRQTKRREAHNKYQKKTLAILIKKATVENLSTIVSKIDKASKVRLISMQKASRIKSRLFKTLKPQKLAPRKSKSAVKKANTTKPKASVKDKKTPQPKLKK